MNLSKLVVFFMGCLFSFVVFAEEVSRSQTVPVHKNEKTSAMKLDNYVYIFLGPGLNPTKDRAEIITDHFKFTAIGIDFSHKEQVIGVAKEMVASGAQLIELCGGFGPLWIAKVSEAINNQVPVGSVAYGPEARKPLLDLTSSYIK